MAKHSIEQRDYEKTASAIQNAFVERYNRLAYENTLNEAANIRRTAEREMEEHWRRAKSQIEKDARVDLHSERSVDEAVRFSVNVVSAAALVVASVISDVAYTQNSREALELVQQKRDEYLSGESVSLGEAEKVFKEINDCREVTDKAIGEMLRKEQALLDKARDDDVQKANAELKVIEADRKAIELAHRASVSDLESRLKAELDTVTTAEERASQAYKNAADNNNALYESHRASISEAGLSEVEKAERLRQAAEIRDRSNGEALQDLNGQRDSYSSIRDEITKRYAAERESLEKKYSAENVRINNREQTVNDTNNVSRDKYTEATKRLRESVRSNYESNDKLRQEGGIDTSAIGRAASQAGQRSFENDRRGVEHLRKVLADNSRALAFDAAYTLGSTQERAALDKYREDKDSLKKLTKERNETAAKLKDKLTDRERDLVQGDLNKLEAALKTATDAYRKSSAVANGIAGRYGAAQYRTEAEIAAGQRGLSATIKKTDQLLVKQRESFSLQNAELNKLIEQKNALLKAGAVKELAKLDFDIKAKQAQLIAAKKEIERIVKLNLGAREQRELLSQSAKALSKRKQNIAGHIQKAAMGKIAMSIVSLQKRFKQEMLNRDELYSDMKKLNSTTKKMSVTYMSVYSFVSKRAAFLAKSVNSLGLMQRFGTTKFGSKVVRFQRTGKTVGGAILKAPGVILAAPSKVSAIPSKLFSKSVTLTGKAALKAGTGAVKFTSRSVGKLYSKTLKKPVKKLYGATVGHLVNALGNTRVGFVVKKATAIARKALGKVGDALGSIKQAIAGFFATLASWVSIGIGWTVVAVGGLSIFIVTTLILLSMFFSVLDAIGVWVTEHTSEYESYVKNNPEYIIEMVDNYRNEELNIYEFFNGIYYTETDGSGNRVAAEVSNDPVFYSLYDTSIDWGWEDNGYRDITGEAVNTSAEAVLERAKTRLNNAGYKNIRQNRTLVSGIVNKFKSWFGGESELDTEAVANIATYSNYSINYIDADDVSFNDDGTVNRTSVENLVNYNSSKLKMYELSNAKDALAIADALYTKKSADIQTEEILAYIGTGDYLLFEESGKSTKSLFWQSHQIVYLEGIESEDVYFHETNETYTAANGQQMYGLSKRRFNSAGSISMDTDTCDNYEIREVTYDKVVTEQYYVPNDTHFDGADWINDSTIHEDYITYNMLRQSDEFDSANATEIANSILFQVNNYAINGTSATHAFDSSATNKITDDKITVKLTYKLDKKSDKTYTSGFNLYKLGTTNVSATGTLGVLYQKYDYLYCVNVSGDYYYVTDKYGNFLTKQMINLGELKEFKYSGKTYRLDSLPGQILLTKTGNGYSMNIYTSLNLKNTTVTIAASKLNQLVSNSGGKTAYIQYYPIFDKGTVFVWRGCTEDRGHGHYETGETTITITEKIPVCLGHINLKAAMVVSTIESENNSMLDICSKLPAVEAGHKFKIFYVNKDANMSGLFGYDVTGYDPAEDFADGSETRTYAQLKSQSAIRYEYTQELADRVKNHFYISSRIANISQSYPPFLKGPDGNIVWCVRYDEKKQAGERSSVYYVTDLVTGEQQDLQAYKLTVVGNSYSFNSKVQAISFCVSTFSGSVYMRQKQ